MLPKEGATLWMDSVCIPARARNVESIYAFLDFIMEPEVNARIVDGISYASANVPARRFIRPDILNDPAIYPPAEALDPVRVRQGHRRGHGAHGRVLDRDQGAVK